MILFPAIDLKDGECVRLERGAMDKATVFNPDPAAQARIRAKMAKNRVDIGGLYAPSGPGKQGGAAYAWISRAADWMTSSSPPVSLSSPRLASAFGAIQR